MKLRPIKERYKSLMIETIPYQLRLLFSVIVWFGLLLPLIILFGWSDKFCETYAKTMEKILK